MDLPDWTPLAPLQRLELDWLARAEVDVAVLRLDLIDPQLSGNKWFKLKPHLRTAIAAGRAGLITLGGSHSNHLHAVAAAGARFGFATVGLLRGEPCDTPTVRDLQVLGMHLHWLGYGGYRARHRADFWRPWLERYPELYPVPEGGGGLPGALGCIELVDMVRCQLAGLGWSDYYAWWLAAGTGTTLAGLVLGEAGQHPVYGALAVPDDHGVARRLAETFAAAGVADAGYKLLDASRGGFARVDAELASFLHECDVASGMTFEPLYTAKALLALRGQVNAGYFRAGTRLIFVHTGGLQGRRALQGELNRLSGSEAAIKRGPSPQRSS